MADLDDFFAKKDRKKTKSKKFATPDELAKKLDDTTKTVRDEPQPSSTPEPAPATEDDEWKEYEDEIQKDFSGLKIQNVELDSINSASNGDVGDTGDGDGDDQETIGAWKKMSAPDVGKPSTGSTNNAKTIPVDGGKKPLAASSTGRYISPALRNLQLLPERIKKDTLPDINNQENFPKLGDAKREEIRRRKNEPAFEEVRSGARHQKATVHATNAPVAIGNRFNSLADS